MNQASESNDLKTRYELLRKEQPEMRARAVAKELGVSEGELLASRIGEEATRLVDDSEAILRGILPLGEVMALTRNESCVLERKGVYDNISFSQHGLMAMGSVANPDIDLRLFMNHWKYNFAVVEQTRIGSRKSLQFFDKAGTAIHKIYLISDSNEAAYDKLVQANRHQQQDSFINVGVYPELEANIQDDEVNWNAVRTAWEALKDPHEFFPMLRKFNVGREQTFSKIGHDLAYEVNNNAARDVLNLARERELELMVFVGNHACIQIHTGTVKKLFEHDVWYNVMDPEFNLHLQENQITRTWVTRKPSVDGMVTALEIFDNESNIIATFFGKRKPGIPESEQWREIITEIPAKDEQVQVA